MFGIKWDDVIQFVKRWGLWGLVILLTLFVYFPEKPMIKIVSQLIFFEMLVVLISTISAFIYTKINFIRDAEKHINALLVVYAVVNISTAIILSGVYLAQFLDTTTP